VESDSGTFRVERLDGRRVDRIRFTPTPDADEAGETDGAGGASGQDSGSSQIAEARQGAHDDARGPVGASTTTTTTTTEDAR
jgi:hypothetical protein